ncbi:MAG: hypothetical protein HYU36_00315 [Planctomycetes bacterium]|nr:hypothetical protein [Planctomycetota bacterium]
MTAAETLSLGDVEIELRMDGDQFLGLGEVRIGHERVRSGRLPLRPAIRTFTGVELASLRMIEVRRSRKGIRIGLEASFRPLAVLMLRDHSFDPIHDTGDWDAPRGAGSGRIDLVLRAARDCFNNVEFHGFSYHYEYHSDTVPLFYILDQASWELDGDITGVTVVSQSSCSDPVVTFEASTAWSTEGLMHWDVSAPNPVMTHNLPRWASHQAFDFQFKGSKTLLGVFERVSLIRTVLRRDPGKPELKTFDKHLFDQALSITTSPKKILFNQQPRSLVDQRNLWTWVMDEVHDRARAEFGLREEPVLTRLAQNYWVNFMVDSYYKDLLPAALSLGVESLFIDNMNKSDMTEHPEFSVSRGNMCCGQEYETGDRIGGPGKLKTFIDDCRRHGLRVYSWTNNDQSYSSPLHHWEKANKEGWFVKMEDTRLKYGGAYTSVFAILDFKREGPRRYWVDSLKQTRDATGLDAYLFDSFYNLGFMPINYDGGRPTTQWRELLMAFKELQDAGISFLIESFGPFGQVQHGCPRSYSIDRCWACYKILLGNDTTTIPGGPITEDPRAAEAAGLYYALAHMAQPPIPLFDSKTGKRIDQVWTSAHRSAIKDFRQNRAFMARRYLQEDGRSVLWHDAEASRATVWNFAAQRATLPGRVRDLTTGENLPRARSYRLKAFHTYAATATRLPAVVES